MKQVKFRSVLLLLLIVLLGLGLALFCLRYTFRGEAWASFSANGHAYTDGVVRTGQVLDRNGTVLYDGPSGVYHEDSALRQATHGHIHGPDTPPPLRQGDILLCGHFHVPVRRDCGRYTYLNPGSVALPKENSPHSCMVLEDGQFTWLDVVTGQPFQPRG